MSNSLIGQEFTYFGKDLIILDEAVINKVDRWIIYITINTNITELKCKIYDYDFYFSYKIGDMLSEDRIRELLCIIFSEVAKFKDFSGVMSHDLFEYKDRFSIYIANEYKGNDFIKILNE